MKITEADLKAAFVAGANWEAQKDDPYMSWASNIKEAFIQHIAARTAYGTGGLLKLKKHTVLSLDNFISCVNIR